MSHELYKRFRPAKLSEVVGQDAVIAQLRKKLIAKTLPHSILFSGPTGTGKTTLMRILRRALRCSINDYVEINTADFRGIEMVRDLRKTVQMQPMGGDSRVIGIDEAHKLSNDAQNAILKLLEDTPDHAYIIIGTTDPQKLLPALLGRCAEYKLKAIGERDLDELIRRVIKAERLAVCEKVIPEIAIAANGSARKALVILEAVGAEDGEQAQMQAISITTVDKDLSFKLAWELMWPKSGWHGVAEILQSMKDEDAEAVRYMVLGFARKQMIGGEGKQPKAQNALRAAHVINQFGTNFYDSKQAGLAFACYNVIHMK